MSENIAGRGGGEEIKTPLENSGVNRTISARGGEERETTTQRGRERKNRFGLERERGVSALKAENSMMTMTTMADGLEAQDSSKSAFMEFGQQSHSQQSSPSMASGHYQLHCLHSGSHAHHQHDNSPYTGTNTYNRSLPYPYVSHPHHSPYLPSYHNNTGGQTRLDGTGKPFSQSNNKKGGEEKKKKEMHGAMSIPSALYGAGGAAFRMGGPQWPCLVLVPCPSHHRHSEFGRFLIQALVGDYTEGG